MTERGDYTDDELEAECHVLGTLMAGKEPQFAYTDALPAVAFCVPFHAATYHALWLLKLTGKPTSPEAVWGLVSGHPEAEHFGDGHLIDLFAACVDVPAYRKNLASMFARAAATCWDLASAVGQDSGGARH